MRILNAAFAVLAVVAAFPVNAAVVLTSANSGYAFSMDYTGQVGGNAAPQVSGLADFVFTGVSNAGKTYSFTYTMKNDSTVNSRLTSWGFDVTNGQVASGSSTGTYASANLNNNYPEGIGTIDLCFEADSNGNCTGGSGGLTKNQTGTGTFSINFANSMASVTLDNFVSRFQSISGVSGGNSGVGFGTLVGGGSGPVSAAPEPMTWMMMLTGFGLIGHALRGRRSRSSPVRMA